MFARSLAITLALVAAAAGPAAEVTKGARWIRGDEKGGTITVRTADGIQQLQAKPEQVKEWAAAHKFGQRITVTFENSTVTGLVRGASEAEQPRDAALFEVVMQLLASDKSGVKKIGVMNFGTVKDQTAAQDEVKADELITLLHHTGRYEMVERDELNRVLKEDQLAAQGVITYATGANLKRKLGIDAVLIGTVLQKSGPDEKRWSRVNARLVNMGGGVLGAGSASTTGSDDASGALDAVMADVADQLGRVEGAKGKKPVVIVADFATEKETADGMWMAEELITRLAQSGKYSVGERRLVAQLMKEKQLQASGLTESNAGALMRLVGADALIVGRLLPQENKEVKLSVRVIGKDASVMQTTEKMLRGKLAALLGGGGSDVSPDVDPNNKVRPYIFAPTKKDPDMPKEWKTSSLIDILNDKNGLRVEGRVGKHFIEVPGLKIKGDFVFEIECHVWYSDMKITFSGPGGQSLMLHLDGLSHNRVTLIDDQSYADNKLVQATNVVKLTRKGGRYHVEVDGEKLFVARRVEQEPNFDTVRFDMNVHDGAAVQIQRFKIIPADSK